MISGKKCNFVTNLDPQEVKPRRCNVTVANILSVLMLLICYCTRKMNIRGGIKQLDKLGSVFQPSLDYLHYIGVDTAKGE